MNTFFKTVKVAITPISPIMIASGETFDLCNIVIDREENTDIIYSFNPSQLDWGVLHDVLLDVANDDSPLALPRFFYNRCRRRCADAAGKNIIPVSESVAKSYQDAMRNSDWNTDITRIVRNATDDIPYIPGSSLKGALRTAVLDNLRRNNKNQNYNNDNWEKNLLGDKSNNYSMSIFRQLKVSDFKSEDIEHAVLMARGYYKKNWNTVRGAQQYQEVILPAQYRCLKGSMTLHTYNGISDINIKDDGNHIFTAPPLQRRFNDFYKIAKDCNAYFKRHLDKELLNYEKKEIGSESSGVTSEWIRGIRELMSVLSENVFLIRLGQHTGSESKTLDGKTPDGKDIAKIRIKHSHGKGVEIKSETYTTWLAQCGKGRQPFGWALIEIDYDEKKDLLELKNWCDKQTSCFPNLSKIKIKIENRAKEKLEMEARARKLNEEKEKKDAKKASMSPSELILEEIRDLLSKKIQNGSAEYVKLRECVLKIKESRNDNDIQEVRSIFKKDQKRQLKKIWDEIKP